MPQPQTRAVLAITVLVPGGTGKPGHGLRVGLESRRKLLAWF